LFESTIPAFLSSLIKLPCALNVLPSLFLTHLGCSLPPSSPTGLFLLPVLLEIFPRPPQPIVFFMSLPRLFIRYSFFSFRSSAVFFFFFLANVFFSPLFASRRGHPLCETSGVMTQIFFFAYCVPFPSPLHIPGSLTPCSSPFAARLLVTSIRPVVPGVRAPSVFRLLYDALVFPKSRRRFYLPKRCKPSTFSVHFLSSFDVSTAATL